MDESWRGEINLELANKEDDEDDEDETEEEEDEEDEKNGDGEVWG